jgi:exopolysaccharide production protein ExoZ
MILEFLLGVAVAHAPNWRLGIWGIPSGAVWLVAAGLIGITQAAQSLDLLLGHDGLRRVLIFGIPSAMIVYGAVQIEGRESVWTYLGDASYSLYLSHTPVMFLLFAFWKKFPSPPELIILSCVSASLLFAWTVHESIEKPIMALFKRQRPAHRQALPRISG